MRLVFIILLIASVAEAQTIPFAARPFQRPLIQNARLVFGLNAPIALLASQVHTESGWRPDARSAYATGLSQFTPATVDFVASKFPEDLGTKQPLNPEWALRALARYDKYLYDRQGLFATDCDRWAFTLSGYNGGEGWVTRDKRLAAQYGADPKKWFGHVEYFSGRSAAAMRENRAYPRRVILQYQPIYLIWGSGIDCRGLA